ncbi:MAG: HigA family addiction module antitoxin, partial [Burkholderiales bacterium]
MNAPAALTDLAAAAPTGAAPARRRSGALRLSSRRPPRPGDFLESRYLKPLAINQTELAQALGISRRRVNELINGKRGITPDTAVRLALFFGNEPMFWMHLQVAWDMHLALREHAASRRK